MDIWQTKEKHKVGKNREWHTVKMSIPTSSMEWVSEGIKRLREDHGVPSTAHIELVNHWTCWIKVSWTKDL